MNTSKKAISVGVSSSLIDLKAELLRKQQALKSSTKRQDDRSRGVQKTTKKSDLLRSKLKDNQQNKGVGQRSQRDRLATAEEEKNLEKSKVTLEAKARLYEKMQQGALLLDNNDEEDGEGSGSAVSKLFSQSLVNFQQKAIDEVKEKRRKLEETSLPESYVAEEPDNFEEEDWTEFTDALGRTRRCLKTDLPAFIERNEALSRPENPGICLSASADDRLREMKREKWDLEAELLAAKDTIHYQDVLFDEVRNHGTGYYKFSHDEATRAQQLRNLKKLSDETSVAKEKLKKDRSSQEVQLKARLKKIQNRKRAKAGLAPLPDSDPEELADNQKEEDKKEETSDLESEKPKEIRAWDFGKAGVFGPRPTTFDELDEKWLKDRRADRNPEFAPPSSIYSERRQQHSASSSSTSAFSSFSSSKYQNFVKSNDSLPSSSSTSKSEPVITEPPPRPFKPPEQFWKSRPPPSSQKPIPIQDELLTDSLISKSKREPEKVRGGGVEIAPPPTFEYYHGDNKPQRQISKKTSEVAMMDAVSSGLKRLREQFETQNSSGANTKEDRVCHNFY